jgi:hypothetical protein
MVTELEEHRRLAASREAEPPPQPGRPLGG